MINSKEISVIVQGKIYKELTPKCVKSIRNYLPDAEVILSTWEGSNVDGLDYDLLILSNDPGAVKTDLVNNVTNNQNRQLVSTRQGISKASKKYILKLRTDFILHSAKFLEYWDRFNARSDEYKIFRHKVIVSTVFSREYSDYNHRPVLFHPSDLFMFGFTEDLKGYFAGTRLATPEEMGNWQYLYPNKIPYPEAHFRYAPEQFFFLSYAKQFFPDIQFEDWSDWNETNQNLSKNILYNNFIFLDYKQAGIYAEKFAYELKNSDRVYGLITFKRYEEFYQTGGCDKAYKLSKRKRDYKGKLRKHYARLIAPFCKVNSWIGEVLAVVYYAFMVVFAGWRKDED